MFETGVGIRNPLFFVGIVENNIDPRFESRVQVRAFGVHGTKDQIPTEDLPWALVVAGNYNMNCIPQQNHWVFGVFLDGRDAQQPLILGTIPTFMSDTLDPERDGIGEHPKTEDEKVQSADSSPERVGQAPCHPLGTGESPHECHPLEHEMNRIKDVRVGLNPSSPNRDFTSWSETATAYNAKYPHNNVYCSPDNNTTVELDSSPGAERLMIWHRGSYIQVDSNGTRTDKSYGDHQEVNDKNNMVYIGGRSSVTIMGDSHVYVDGNKIEEINGDLIQVVHGNHILGVGGQSTLNASEEVQIRGGQIRMESNVSGINLKAAKSLFAQTGESMHFKSGIAIFQEATNSFNMKAGDNIYIQAGETGHIKAKTVNIDDTVNMANNDAESATAADPSKSVEAPPPPEKSTSISSLSGGRNRPNVGTAGAASVDDPVESSTSNSVQDVSTPDDLDTSLGQNPASRQRVYDKLRDLGLTHEQAIGVMANINRESAFKPGAIGDNGNSYGLFQYNRGAGRLQPFVTAVPDWQTNVNAQLEYTFNEENTGIQFKNTSFNSSLEAANWFTNYFEIPENRSSYTAEGGYNSRIVPKLEAEIIRRS